MNRPKETVSKEVENLLHQKGCPYSHPSLYDAQQWIIEAYQIMISPMVELNKDEDESTMFICEAFEYKDNMWQHIELEPTIECGKYLTYQDALNDGLYHLLIYYLK